MRQIRREMPDIILADLNMPGMSGVELLAIVWRRFPAVQKIAMSGEYPSNAVPAEVAADAFFQKGDGIGELLQVIQTLPWGGYRARQRLSASAPLRIQIDGHPLSSATCVTIQCPECLRTFSRPAGAGNSFIRETDCIHCGNSIQYSIVGHRGHARLQPFKRVTSATLRVEQN